MNPYTLFVKGESKVNGRENKIWQKIEEKEEKIIFLYSAWYFEKKENIWLDIYRFIYLFYYFNLNVDKKKVILHLNVWKWIFHPQL